jgi:hypothetical protein
MDALVLTIRKQARKGDAFGVVAPKAAERAALEKDRCSDSRTVMDAKILQTKDSAC